MTAWHDATVSHGHVAAAVEALALDPADVRPFSVFLDALAPALDRLPRPARLLDVGCGAGHYGELLDRVHPGRFDYVGADLPAMVAEARHLFPDRAFIVADLERGEPVLDGYDVVLASGVIPTLEDWQGALRRLLACPAPLVFLHRQELGWRNRTRSIPAYGQTSRYVTISRLTLRTLAARFGRTCDVHAAGSETAALLWRRGR